MNYLINKIAYAILTLFGVVTVIFFLFNVLPGDPAQMMLGQNEDSEQLAIVKQKYGFDKPLGTQYLYYLNDLSPLSFHSKEKDDYTFLREGKYTASKLFTIGNTTTVLKFPYLRESFTKQGKKVSQVLGETLPNTFVLAVSAIVIAMILGVILGIVSALYKDQWIDKTIQIFSTLGMSVPSFFSAILFAWFFGFVLHEYTNLEMTGSLYELDDFGEAMHIKWKNLILPAVVLGIRPLAVVIQLMRNSLLEVFNQDYIRTARAKGLSEFQIIKKHAVKKRLKSGSYGNIRLVCIYACRSRFCRIHFWVERLGKEIVNALNTLDLPVIMGAVLVIAVLFVIINIFVDLIYVWLDPKVKLK